MIHFIYNVKPNVIYILDDALAEGYGVQVFRKRNNVLSLTNAIQFPNRVMHTDVHIQIILTAIFLYI